jgi:rare lipoprotein A
MERGMISIRWTSGLLGLVGCLMASGCASVSKGDIDLDLGIKDRGVASWYGKNFHGRVAANGEVFDMTALTAAHRKLPLGSLVRVVNLVNGRHVQVRINDRGPYVIGRMLDVSYAAAVELGMIQSGTSIVHLEVIGQHRPLVTIVEALSPMAVERSFPVRLESGKEEKGLQTRGLSLGIHPPHPVERLFPREILHERRERRHATVLAGDYAAHNPIPTLTV